MDALGCEIIGKTLRKLFEPRLDKYMIADTCIIVAPFSTGAFLPAALRAFGLRAIAVISNEHPMNGVPAFHDSDFESIYRYEGDIDALIRQLPPRMRIASILAGSDLGVVLADQLKNKFSMWCGATAGDPLMHRDKFIMIEKVARSGLCVPSQISSDDPSLILRWAREKKFYPLIVKPRMSMASDGVSICHDEQDLQNAVGKLLGTVDFLGNKNDQALVQKLVAGDEYMVDTVSCDGYHRVVALWKSVRGRTSTPVPEFSEALDAHDPVYRQLADYCANVLSTLGVHFGPAHTEIIINPESGPTLVEVNVRFHGTLDLLFPSTLYGTNQVVEAARAIAAPDIFLTESSNPLKLFRCGMKVYLHSCVDGLVTKLPDWSAITSLPSFCSMTSRVREGQPISITRSLSTSPGTVFLIANSRTQLAEDYAVLRASEDSFLYADCVQ